MKSLFPRLNKYHLRIFFPVLLPILLLVLIGVGCTLADKGMPTPAPASTVDSVNPATETPGENIPTQPAEARLATPSPTLKSTSITLGGRYLFIEFWNNENGTGSLPSSAIDPPHYYFDPTSGELSINLGDTNPLSPTDLGFIGQGISLTGTIGTGIGCGLAVIDRVPFSTKVYLFTRQVDQQPTPTMEEAREVTLTILSAAEDGTVSIVLDGQIVTLVPGQSWVQIIEKDIKTDQYDGQLTLTSTLTNYGWQERAKINVTK